jgi:hypothetical protein
MGTDLATTGPSPFEAYGMTAGGRTIQGELLRFTKFGEYQYGQEAKKLTAGTQFVAQMPLLQVGWLKWLDGKPVDERMGYVAESFVPPRRADLDCQDQATWPAGSDGKARDVWQFHNSLPLVDPDNGEVFTFSTASRGGIGAIAELCRHYGRHSRQHPGELPVIALEVSSYRHKNKEFGEIRVPSFRIVRWEKGEETAASVAQQSDEMSDEVPF